MYSKARTRRVSTGEPSRLHDGGERHLQTVDASVLGELLFHGRAPSRPRRRVVALGTDQIRRRVEQQDDRLHRAATDAKRRQTAPLLDDVRKTRRGYLAVGSASSSPMTSRCTVLRI